jgi:hypothetical protein
MIAGHLKRVRAQSTDPRQPQFSPSNARLELLLRLVRSLVVDETSEAKGRPVSRRKLSVAKSNPTRNVMGERCGYRVVTIEISMIEDME